MTRIAKTALCATLALWVGLVPDVLDAQAREAPGSGGEARVLLLFSYHPAFVTTAAIRDTVTALLGARGVAVDVEYMDSKRHPDARWREMFTAQLAFKLARRAPYDAVIVSDDNALDLALREHQELLHSAPLVFLAVNDLERAQALDANPAVTGVVEHISVAETVRLARRLDPQLREVVALVDGTTSGIADRAALAAVAAGTGLDGVRVTLLSMAEFTWQELAARLASLGPGQAVLRLSLFRDRLGKPQSLRETNRLIARSAPVPAYELRRVGVGWGMIGGVVVDFTEQARAASRMALAILDGEPVGSLPVLTQSPNVALVDAQVMKRFDIDPALVPAGTTIVNEPQGPAVGKLSTFLAAVVVLLLLLLCYLLVSFLRRVQNERLTRDREERFRILVEDSLQGVLINRHRVPLFANQSYADILGYDSPEELLALGDVEHFYAPHERERLRGYREARLAGQPAPTQYNFEAVRKDGSIAVLHNVVHVTTWNGQAAIQHNISDVTERERARRLLQESEERYRTLVENATEALVVLDVDENRFIDANSNALALFGVEADALQTMNPAMLSPLTQPGGRDSRALAEKMIRRALEGEQVQFEWVHRAADGREVPTEIRLVRLPSSTRRLVRGSITDVSERLAARRALMEKSAQLEATFENTDQGISMVDADLNVVAFNQRFLELLEFPSDHFAQGEPLAAFFRYNAERGEYGPGDVEEQVRERLNLAHRFEAHRFTRTRPDGTVLEICGRPLPGGGFVTTYTDITENYCLSQQLSHQARHDALTDLLNRREFEQQLERLLHGAREDGRSHAMCYLDLDQFKVVNDTCGHMAGDELLRQLSATLHAKVRKSDVLARLGGDEFGVLLEDCPLHEAQRVAAALRAAVEEFRFSWDDKSFRLGVSIGLVPVTADSGNVAHVMSAADTACYAAKDQGRNRVHLFSEGDETLADRQGEMRWVVRLQQAMEEDRLCLMSQPIVPLQSGPDEGPHFEVLIRMRGEDGGLIAPGQFLPAAERYNMMGRLDRWVVSTAFRVLAPTPGETQPPYTCSINLSGQSLGDDEFLDFIIAEFRDSGVPAERIVFEVTETAAISNLTRATRFMSALKDIGCRFALDDFGSGLSSFGYLKTLPVDFLKIDGMFVKDILDDPIDHAMVRSINEIGHVMGKRTIAEFVESDSIRERLEELGVDYAQGYGVGRPHLFEGITGLRRAS